MNDARKAGDKTRRQQVKQTRADRERKITLVGEAVMRRLDRGEWDEADFRKMTDESAWFINRAFCVTQTS
jgi:hypothetical protein